MEIIATKILLIKRLVVLLKSTAPNLSFITSISKSFVWISVRSFCNISVNSIDLSPVFIGIFKTRDAVDQFEGAMVLSITVLMSIVPNTTKPRAFAVKETSAPISTGRLVTQNAAII